MKLDSKKQIIIVALSLVVISFVAVPVVINRLEKRTTDELQVQPTVTTEQPTERNSEQTRLYATYATATAELLRARSECVTRVLGASTSLTDDKRQYLVMQTCIKIKEE